MQNSVTPKPVPVFGMSADLEKCTRDLLCACENEALVPDNLIICMHQFLKSVLLEEYSTCRRPAKRFMCAFRAAICVTARGRRNVPISRRSRYGFEVSPTNAAVLKFSSCCAIMEVFSFTREASRLIALQQVKSTFVPGTNSAIGLLSDIRAICSRLRTQDMSRVRYEPCSMPGNFLCEVVNSTHLTLTLVGKVLMRMHKLFNEVLRTILYSQEIPSCPISGLDSLQGKGNESKNGY